MIKFLSEQKTFTYVIECKDYLELKDQLNKEKKYIITINPTYVANQISDRFVIIAANR